MSYRPRPDVACATAAGAGIPLQCHVPRGNRRSGLWVASSAIRSTRARSERAFPPLRDHRAKSGTRSTEDVGLRQASGGFVGLTKRIFDAAPQTGHLDDLYFDDLISWLRAYRPDADRDGGAERTRSVWAPAKRHRSSGHQRPRDLAASEVTELDATRAS